MGQLGSVYLLSSQIVNFFRPPNMTRIPVLSFSGHCANDRGRRSLDFISDLVADGGDDARCRMHRLLILTALKAYIVAQVPAEELVPRMTAAN
jgi:hypothetical protein